MSNGDIPDDTPAGPSPAAPSPSRGVGIIRASVGGTVAFVALAAGALFVDALVPPFVILSLVMFLVGSVLFVVAFIRAVDRSRTEAIGIGGLFFGAGTAPRRVQVLLMVSLAIEVAVALGAASIRPYTPLAFGTLAPMWALGLAGLWVASHGVFPERAPEPTRSAQRDADRAAHRRVGRGEENAPVTDDATPADDSRTRGSRPSGAGGASG